MSRSPAAFMASFGAGLYLAALVTGCDAPVGQQPPVPGGDARVGKALVIKFECGACHEIPGVPGARGTVGPPLRDFGRQIYIAGRYPNLPEQLIRWIQDAPSLDPQTAMPDLGVSEGEARHIAAYLYDE